MDAIKNWNATDIDIFRDLIKKNEEAIRFFEEATRIEGCDFTFGKFSDKHKYDSALCHPIKKYVGLLDLSRILLLRGKLSEDGREYAKTARDYVTVLRFSTHLKNQKDYQLINTMFIDSFVAKCSLPLLAGLLRRDDIGVDIYQELLDSLKDYKDSEKTLESLFNEAMIISFNMLLMPFRWTLDEDLPAKHFDKSAMEKWKQDNPMDEQRKALLSTHKSKERLEDLIAAGELLSSLFIPWLAESFRVAYTENNSGLFPKRLRAFGDQFMRSGQKDAQTKDSSFAATRSFFREKNMSEVSEIIKTNPNTMYVITGITMATMSPQVGAYATRFIPFYYHKKTDLDLLILGYALKLYQLENNRLPDSLEELVPIYIDEVPTDYFNMPSKIRYKKSGDHWTIYSVGLNRKYDGGKRSKYSFTEGWDKYETIESADLVLSSSP